MIVLLLAFAGSVGSLAGLVALWRRRDPILLKISILALGAAGVAAFTAEIWYRWFGFSRGDGQVFIGYYLFGMGAFAIAGFALIAIPIVLALRPKKVAGEYA